MKKQILLLAGITIFPIATFSQVGVNTVTPQKTLHVNGSIQLTNELNVGGNSNTAGNAGALGQILTSNGPNVAPSWANIGSIISGLVSNVYYFQGTSTVNVNAGQTADVPGLVFTHTVPAGRTQTLLFSILGYVGSTAVTGTATQGVFILLQDNVKISSAYVSKVGNGGGLLDLPVPVTFLKAVTLSEGTYTFKVQFKAWSGSQAVNVIPTTYVGYDGDTESMLSKMQVLIYNN
ncbi:hypothetical protein [Chryseobacterium oryctis]|uniref:Uncharacterized protein n=1 Tax=Chryseobacterium oryctis TaxID=2952618 RepID=A0ABT3HM25_9FLAO|nr:hypothetical protein [Chryseobacterium oryctis]MCW3160841.1 hypothetical protein [Chryseobacterium oryctis]